jgi:hypothetical protein
MQTLLEKPLINVRAALEELSKLLTDCNYPHVLVAVTDTGKSIQVFSGCASAQLKIGIIETAKASIINHEVKLS